MRKWAHGSCQITINLLLALTSASAFAQSIPLPRHRPAQPSDAASDAGVIHLPLYSQQDLSLTPFVGQPTPDQSAAGAKPSAQNGQSWTSRMAQADSDLAQAQKAKSDADLAAQTFARQLTLQSAIEIRARLATYQINQWTAALNVSYYKFIQSDLKAKAQSAQVTTAQSQLATATRLVQALTQRENSDLYHDGLSELTQAQAKQAQAQAAYTSALQSYQALLSAAQAESANYAKLKTSLNAAEQFSATVASRLKDKASWDAKASAFQPQFSAADLTTKGFVDQMDTAAKQPNGILLTTLRLKAVQAQTAAAQLRQSALPTMTAVAKANLAAEILIAPLTPSLGDSLIALAKQKQSDLTAWISPYNTIVQNAPGLTKKAKARLNAVQSASDDFDRAQTAIGADGALSKTLVQAQSVQTQAQAAVAALQPRSATDTQLAQAGVNLAKARADVALAQDKLAQARVVATQKALALTQAIQQTETALRAFSSAQTRDNSTDLGTQLTKLQTAKVSTADSSAKASALAVRTASAAKELGNEATTRDANALQVGLDGKSPSPADLALAQVKSDARTLLAQSPDAVTLFKVRAKVAQALIAQQTALVGIKNHSVAWQKSRLDAANTLAKSADDLFQLTSIRLSDNRADATGKLNQAQSGLAQAQSDLATLNTNAKTAQTLSDKQVQFDKAVSDATKTWNARAADVNQASAKAQAAQIKFDDFVKSGAAPVDVANARVILDRAKAEKAHAALDEAKAQMDLAEAQLEADSAAAQAPAPVVAFYPFNLPDNRRADKTLIESLLNDINRLAKNAKDADTFVVDDRVNVLTLTRKLSDASAAQAAAQVSQSKARESGQSALRAKVEFDQKVTSVHSAIQWVKANLTPTLNGPMKNAEDQRTSAVAVLQRNGAQAGLVAARANVKAAEDALAAAQAQVTAASATFEAENAKRDTMQSSALAIDAIDLEAAHQLLNKSESNLRIRYQELQAADDALEAANTALEQANPGSVALTESQDLEKEKAQTRTALVNLDVSARQAAIARADAMEAHGRALDEGRMARDVSFDEVVDRKSIELDGQYCKADKQTELSCLACTARFEAQIDPSFQDKVFTATSVIVRTLTGPGRWGATICEAAHKKAKGVCQYSWYCESDNKDNNEHVLSGKWDRQEIKAAIVAYYQSTIAYPYDSYWNPKKANPDWKRDCRTSITPIGMHVGCRVGTPLDTQEYSEQALVRARTDHVNEDSIQKNNNK